MIFAEKFLFSIFDKKEKLVFLIQRKFFFFYKKLLFFFKLVYKTIRFCYTVNGLNIKLYKRPHDG